LNNNGEKGLLVTLVELFALAIGLLE